MKNFFVFLLFLAFILSAVGSVWAEDKETELPRDDKGAFIPNATHLKIPKDRKVVSVVSNVVRPEEEDAYMDRRMGGLEERIEKLEGRIQSVESRLDKVEKTKQ